MRIARAYEGGGAAALCVLTDETFFQGSLARSRKRARGGRRVPVLRKDFTIDPLQILEAAAHGADAILLIAAILTEREIRDFREAAARYRHERAGGSAQSARTGHARSRRAPR